MTVTIGEYVFDHIHYDSDADVLYLSMGEPRPGTGEETPEGHILRFDKDGKFMGITLLGARELVEAGPVRMTVPSAQFVEPDDLVPALAS